MDTIKIGSFLATLRKEQGLTQEALGEKLGVTNKTVSRWENGNYLPPVEMLQELSKLYSVSINEILCGERLEKEEYQAKAEETITGILSGSSFTFKERSDFWKRKWNKDHFITNLVLAVILLIMLCAGIVLSEPLVVGIAPVFALVVYMVRRNDMMIYVENNLYGPIK
ncbi:MAG: helix-turn-helix domain-containing protein [Lachnospiraceae bacterium]|nr:helix-turn-helix domain-containing protein [Lachnospiraceae bacterium]